jgi:hypothetical protein
MALAFGILDLSFTTPDFGTTAELTLMGMAHIPFSVKWLQNP